MIRIAVTLAIHEAWTPRARGICCPLHKDEWGWARMLGIYSRLIGILPKGAVQDALRSITIPKPPKPLPEDCRPWYWKEATLTHTMADSRREDWERILEPYRREIRTVLELGSYEGQSALFWINHFGASVTCIDNWQNFADGCSSASEVERHFDANLRGRAHKIKDNSTPALYSLKKSHAMFDLIYIDGDHSADQVMVDSILAWGCLRFGGIMIWDDYCDTPETIDFFRRSHSAEFIGNTGQQMFVRRR